jgi:hypothetical protein
MVTVASASEPEVSSRGATLELAVLALVVLVSLRWSVHPWYDATNDGSMYIATARALAAGEGYTYNGAPFLIRPPGFSALIAPLLAWRGTDFYALNLAVSLAGGLGVLLFQRWARARLGGILALAAALVLWFNPGYQRLCTQVMSDVPGCAALFGLFLAARAAARRSSGAAWFGVGLALGVGSLVRSGNLLFLPALAAAWGARELFARAAALGWKRTLAHGAALALGCGLVLVPWSVRNRVVAPPPPADQTLLYSYGSGMWHTDLGDPRSPRISLGEVLGRFPKQTKKLVTTLGERLAERPGGAATPWVAGVLLLALLVALVRHRAAEEFLACGTLVVVAFYFGYAGRLLLPVFALALVALLEGVRTLAGRFLGGRAGSAAALALAAGVLVFDWRPREHWAEVEALHTAFERSAAQLARQLPPEAKLGAFRGWDHAVYLERDVYSFENAIRREGLAGGLEAVLAKYELDCVLLTPLGLPEPVAREEREFAAELARRFGGRELGLVRVR